MWRLYAAERKGLAVHTTARRLRDALLPFRLAPNYGEEEPWWGSVKYVDLHRERLRVGMEKRFFCKHRAFESEREFRVAISARMAEEYGVEVPEFGIECPSTRPSSSSPSTSVQPLLHQTGKPCPKDVKQPASTRAS